MWARDVVQTRGMAAPAQLVAGDGVFTIAAGELVIVPLLDMANHAQGAQLELSVGAGGRELQAVTIVPVR